jgi:hypothetical protein
VQLTAAELALIDEVFPIGSAAGQRYPESFMSSVGR